MRPKHLFVLASTSMLFGACTMVGAPLPPGPAPASPVRFPASPPPATPPATGAVPAPAPVLEAAPASARLADEVVRIALDAVGTPYVWGGDGEDGFDCSGLIQFAYGELGIRLPRVSSDQLRAGSPVPADFPLLEPGDVLGFADDPSGAADHVGLYVGDGRFLHSSSTGVRISTLLDLYWRQRLVAARRIVG